MKTPLSIRCKSFAGLLLAGGLLTSAIVPAARANLILNGSFESPDLGPGNHFNVAAPTSWTGAGNNYTIHNFSLPNATYPAAQDGNQYLATDSAHVTQGFTIGTAGDYLLTWFDGTIVTGNTGSYHVNVLDSSLVVVSSQTIIYNYFNGSWHQRSLNLTGLAVGNYSLEIGTAASGTFFDNVVLDAVGVVPEPTTMLAGALLLLPFGASTLRVLRKHRNS